MKVKNIFLPLKIVSLSLALIAVLSCSNYKVKKGMLILTEARVSNQPQENLTGISGHYYCGARISAIFPGRPESLNVLTKDFYSACSPDISYDGRSMLFAAQQKKDESWQIWEMDLDNLKYKKITTFKENCTDPVYLPGGRIVFSKLTVNDTVRSAYCLYVCNLNGSGVIQITYSPADNLATTVLKDGRVLTVSRQLVPEERDPMLMVMRPDGTKADMFYMNDTGNILISRPHETSDGKIVFIESDKKGSSKGDLFSITYNRPLHTKVDLTSFTGKEFCSVMPIRIDKYLVCCRNSVSERFSLYEFDPRKKSLGQSVFSDPDYDVVDAALVEEYVRPRKLPSEVDLQVKTGLLLCQDLNYTGLQMPENGNDIRKALKIEVLGVDTTYGVVQVEEDGSFQLKVMADKPFRITTLDAKGNVVNGPCTWLWLRPNERRGCIGCHEDPELAPENKVSLAIMKPPVIVPVHITEIKEKIVDLE